MIEVIVSPLIKSWPVHRETVNAKYPKKKKKIQRPSIFQALFFIGMSCTILLTTNMEIKWIDAPIRTRIVKLMVFIA
jgi:hypothetical protein